ncbi:hypothetical protein [Xanthobacter pseudotagetidis]|uniref:hypothetical protein n=1 Tax=Xanthobacter pseudotagetidis TaxID=3119911 RepID=UPI00372B1132
MEIAVHMEKVGRLEDLLGRLDPQDDFELYMWTCMTAGTQALNAAMHALGVTEPGRLYPHQIPGIYVEPEPVDGRWRLVMAAPGDVIHLGLPPVARPVPAVLEEASGYLTAIEDLREVYVRGGEAIMPDVVALCQAAYGDLMAILKPLIPNHAASGGGAP